MGLWLELIDGVALGDLVRLRGPLSAPEATLVGIDVCRALAAVHGAGLVHGNISAHNVMREQGGRIVLMDFGAANAPARANDSVANASGEHAVLRGAGGLRRRPALQSLRPLRRGHVALFPRDGHIPRVKARSGRRPGGGRIGSARRNRYARRGRISRPGWCRRSSARCTGGPTFATRAPANSSARSSRPSRWRHACCAACRCPGSRGADDSSTPKPTRVTEVPRITGR